MKKYFSILFALLFSIFIASPSFAYDICGWWKAEGKRIPNTPDLLKITDNKFHDFTYKSTEDDRKISLYLNRSKKPTDIKIISKDDIMITNIRGQSGNYKLITRDTTLTREQVTGLLKIKKDQVEK